MAIVQTDKAKNLATRAVDAAERFRSALAELLEIESERVNSGVSFTDEAVEAVLADSDLKHVDGSSLNLLLSSAKTIDTFITSNFHSTNLDKVRRGTGN